MLLFFLGNGGFYNVFGDRPIKMAHCKKKKKKKNPKKKAPPQKKKKNVKKKTHQNMHPQLININL
jgi:hypothetical protein